MTADSDAVIYPPERTATAPCGRCNGQGARSAIAGHCFSIDGDLWHRPGECKSCPGCCPPCSSCHGSGTVPRNHYAYCKRQECIGCLPTMAEIEQMPILGVWAEMLARCIPQSPDTKTHEGAVAAIRQCDGWYHSVAYFARRNTFLKQAIQAVLDGDECGAQDRLILGAVLEQWT